MSSVCASKQPSRLFHLRYQLHITLCVCVCVCDCELYEYCTALVVGQHVTHTSILSRYNKVINKLYKLHLL